MFCGKCGNSNPDTAALCLNCGNPLQTASAGELEMTEAERKRYRTIGMVATGIFAVLVIALIFAIFGGKGASSPKNLAKQYMKAFLKADVADIVDLVHDKEIDYLLDQTDMSKKEFKKKVKELSEDLEDSMEEVEGYKISYEIESVENASSKVEERIKAYYKDNCDLKVKDIKEVNIKVTVKKGDNSMSPELSIYAVKIGGSWYLPMESLDSLL